MAVAGAIPLGGIVGKIGRGAAAKAHRAHQADLIAKGDFRGAQQLDIDDIRMIFGNKYDLRSSRCCDIAKKWDYDYGL